MAHAADVKFHEHWYRSSLNHRETKYTILLIEDGSGHLFVRQLDIALLGIKKPSNVTPMRYSGESYYPIDSLKGIEVFTDDIANRVHFVSAKRTHIEKPGSNELLLNISVNGGPPSKPLYVRYRAGELILPEQTMRALGIDPKVIREPLIYGDVPLHAAVGENFSFDLTNLSMEITVPSMYLKKSTVFAGREKPLPKPKLSSGLSAIFSYDLVQGKNISDETWNSGLIDLTVANGRNTCSTSHLRLPGSDKLLRLESNCIADWPEHLLSLGAGDSVTRAGMLGQSVLYGGVHFGTDYGLSPSLVTQPFLTMSGSARVPSTLEIWVNQMRTLSTDIPPGPFDLTDIPVYTGAGEVRAVIRNAQGGREVLTQSFYSDPVLLAAGLKDWAVELGRTREGYATEQSEYKDRFALFTGRFGLSQWMTVETRAEVQEESALLGVGSNFRLWNLGIFEYGIATSRDENDVKANAQRIGFSRRSQYFSFGLQRMTTDVNFQQLGYSSIDPLPAEVKRANIGISLGGRVSLNMGGFERHYHDGERQEFRTAALNIPIMDWGAMHISAFKQIDPKDDTIYSANITIPFGERSNVSGYYSRQNNLRDRQITIQQNLPVGPGFGYRVSSGEQNNNAIDIVEASLQGDTGLLFVSGMSSNDDDQYQAQLTGSIVMSGNNVYLSRKQQGSIAVVDLPVADTEIYYEGRLAATTNSSGKAVIPGLRPFEENRLQLGVDKLPFNTDISRANIAIVPGRRQAVMADFGVELRRYLSTRLVLRNNKTVPAGVKVRFDSTKETVTGYNGKIFLAIRSGGYVMRLRAKWANNECSANIAVPDNQQNFIELGTVRCVED
ncbi:MAG: fimbrial biogenesis outer membrane usher protein [Gammaproteobacteria bacterium]|nr:fimbrial biogenesis outer membrane usher protein [Gammaproteobacteria bacterium]